MRIGRFRGALPLGLMSALILALAGVIVFYNWRTRYRPLSAALETRLAATRRTANPQLPSLPTWAIVWQAS